MQQELIDAVRGLDGAQRRRVEQAEPVCVQGRPEDLLAKLDPEIVALAKTCKDRFSKRFDTLLKHEHLLKKYAQKLHNTFNSEAKTAWQWPAEYKLEARQVEAESEEQRSEMTEAHDIDKAWKRLRVQHAEGCNDIRAAAQRENR